MTYRRPRRRLQGALLVLNRLRLTSPTTTKQQRSKPTKKQCAQRQPFREQKVNDCSFFAPSQSQTKRSQCRSSVPKNFRPAVLRRPHLRPPGNRLGLLGRNPQNRLRVNPCRRHANTSHDDNNQRTPDPLTTNPDFRLMPSIVNTNQSFESA